MIRFMSNLFLLLLTTRALNFIKYLESTSVLKKYSSLIGNELIKTKETNEFIKKARYLIQFSTINILLMTIVLTVEVYCLGVNNLLNRILLLIIY